MTLLAFIFTFALGLGWGAVLGYLFARERPDVRLPEVTPGFFLWFQIAGFVLLAVVMALMLR
jgi:hypothetical protein